MLKSQNPRSRRSIGLGGFDFSRRISGKYGVIRRSGGIFSLVFYRFFSKKSETNSGRKCFRPLIQIFQKKENIILKNFLPYQKQKEIERVIIRENLHKDVYPVIKKAQSFGEQSPETGDLTGKQITSPVKILKEPQRYMNVEKNSLFSSYSISRTTALNYAESKYIQRNDNITRSPEVTPAINKNEQLKPSESFSMPHKLTPKIKRNEQEENKTVILEKQPLLQQPKFEAFNSYENSYKGAPEKNILFSSCLRFAALNYAKPINISYLNRIFDTSNTRSVIKRVINFRQSGKTSFDRPAMEKTIQPLIQRTEVENVISHKNSNKYEPGKNIILSSYLKSRIIASNHVYPTNANYHREGKTSFDGTAIPEKALLQQTKVERVISHENSYKYEPGKNILFPSYLRSRIIALNHVYPTTVNYQPDKKTSFDGTAIQEKTKQASLQRTKVEKVISHENSYKYEPGKNILFPSYLRSNNIFLSKMNPENVNYQISGKTSYGRYAIMEKTLQPLLQQANVVISYENSYKYGTGKTILIPSYLRSITLNQMYQTNVNYQRSGKISFNTESLSPGTLHHKTMQEREKDTTLMQERTNHPMSQQTGISLNYVHPTTISEIRGGNHFNPYKTSFTRDKILITEKLKQLLLPQTRIEKMISYENLYRYAPGKNVLFPSYLRSGMALNYALYRSPGILNEETLKKRIPGAINVIDDFHGSSEMIFKKPQVQSTEIVQEKKTQLHDKIDPKYIEDSFIKKSLEKRSISEISKIADSVYKIIERKIMVEKDRRGLLW